MLTFFCLIILQPYQEKREIHADLEVENPFVTTDLNMVYFIFYDAHIIGKLGSTVSCNFSHGPDSIFKPPDNCFAGEHFLSHNNISVSLLGL